MIVKDAIFNCMKKYTQNAEVHLRYAFWYTLVSFNFML